MPALEIRSTRPALGHVNLMPDTFIANVQLDDLRTIVRDLLASGIPNIGSTFSAVARARMAPSALSTVPAGLFSKASSDNCLASPTELLKSTVAHARCLYGSGLGFASLGVLNSIVSQTLGLRWNTQGDMIAVLTEIDADISQAIQSCKEELEADRVRDATVAHERVADLRRVLLESKSETESWGGEYPFERAYASVQYWKMGISTGESTHQQPQL